MSIKCWEVLKGPMKGSSIDALCLLAVVTNVRSHFLGKAMAHLLSLGRFFGFCNDDATDETNNHEPVLVHS